MARRQEDDRSTVRNDRGMRHDDKAAIRLTGKRSDRALDFDIATDVDRNDLHISIDGATASTARRKVTLMTKSETKEHRHPAHGGRRLLEQAQPLASHGRLETLETSGISTGSRQAGNKTASDRIGDLGEQIGIVPVSFCVSAKAVDPATTITSGAKRTNTAAAAFSRLGSPELQRYSMWTLWPSVQPSLCSVSRKAAMRA